MEIDNIFNQTSIIRSPSFCQTIQKKLKGRMRCHDIIKHFHCLSENWQTDRKLFPELTVKCVRSAHTNRHCICFCLLFFFIIILLSLLLFTDCRDRLILSYCHTCSSLSIITVALLTFATVVHSSTDVCHRATGKERQALLCTIRFKSVSTLHHVVLLLPVFFSSVFEKTPLYSSFLFRYV